MTKQLVNLVGGLVTVVILAAGILLFALPQFSASQRIGADAAAVEQNNNVQRTLLDVLNAQASDMGSLEAEVAALREVVPETARGDDVVLLAADAAAAHGGVVRAITVGAPEPFVARTGAVDGDAAAAPVAETPEAVTPPADASGTAAAPATDAAPADGPQQVSVTLSIGAADRAAATAIIDALRQGPRAVAITQAAVVTTEEGSTAEVVLLAFISA